MKATAGQEILEIVRGHEDSGELLACACDALRTLGLEAWKRKDWQVSAFAAYVSLHLVEAMERLEMSLSNDSKPEASILSLTRIIDISNELAGGKAIEIILD